jgi:hypothetical protein
MTLLLDALDEAAQPLQIAREMLAPLTRLPRFRIVVGARHSTREAPDHPAEGHRDLIDALSTGHDPDARPVIVTVKRHR